MKKVFTAMLLSAALATGVLAAQAQQANTQKAQQPTGTKQPKKSKEQLLQEKQNIVVDDSKIVASLKNKIDKAPPFRGSKINVESKNGAVVLSGTTKTLRQKLFLNKLAQNESGVKSVDDSRLTAEVNKMAVVREGVPAADPGAKPGGAVKPASQAPVKK